MNKKLVALLCGIAVSPLAQAEFIDMGRSGFTGSFTIGGSSGKFESNYYKGAKDDVKATSL